MARPLPPSKAMLAAIGRVAAECAAVEDRLRNLLCFLMDSEYGRVVASGEDLANIAVLCQRVTRYNVRLTDNQVEQLYAIMKAVDALRPHRNFLIHARWERLSEPGQHIGIRSSRISVRRTGQGTEQGLIWTPADANELADQFAQVAAAIDRYIDQTFDTLRFTVLLERESWLRFSAMFDGLFTDAPTTGPADDG